MNVPEKHRRLNQAQRVISKFGDYRILAELCGKNPTTVWRWTKSKAEGGTGGVIPVHARFLVEDAANKAKVKLTKKDWAFD